MLFPITAPLQFHLHSRCRVRLIRVRLKRAAAGPKIVHRSSPFCSSRSRSSPSLSSTCMRYKTSNTPPNVPVVYCFQHLQRVHQKISHKSVPSAAWVAHIPQARRSGNQSQRYNRRGVEWKPPPRRLRTRFYLSRAASGS